ncbi:MAG: hypothetical protein ACFE68_05930 [Candidatus Hodarchaeota archaeon]
MPREILDSRPINLAEVKEILDKRSEETELGYIGRITREYAAKFSHVEDSKTANELVDFLVSEYDFDKKEAIMLVNVLPLTIDELRPLISEFKSVKKDLKTEDLQTIVEVFKEKSKKVL